MRSRIFVTSLALALVFGALRADADTIGECASTSENGQRLRNQRSWIAARKEFLSCAQSRCPAIVRTDCEQWLGELARAMPTVIVSAKDSRGRDLVDVRLFVDGVLVAERADGSAVPLDPGPHELRYESAGSAPIHETIVALEAEKYRRLHVLFTTQEIERPDRIAARRSHKPVGAYVLGAAGILSLGTFLYLNIDGQSEFDGCKESRACTPSDIDALDTKRYVAWGALGAGIVTVGVAGFWLLKDDDGSSRVRASAVVAPDRVTAILRAEF